MPIKKILILTTSLVALSFSAIILAKPCPANLKVLVTGFGDNKGVVIAALYNNKYFYNKYIMGGKGLYKALSAPVKNYQSQVVFKCIPYGNYAIKLFHDRNLTGKLEKNFLGIPKEGFGFSNNPRIGFKPPKWKKVNFAVDKKNSHQQIKLVGEKRR